MAKSLHPGRAAQNGYAAALLARDGFTAGEHSLEGRTTASLKIKGVAAMTSMPMYLNTRSGSLKKLEDLTDKDKIAVTAIKVSIPALVMQMYARSKYGPPQARPGLTAIR